MKELQIWCKWTGEMTDDTTSNSHTYLKYCISCYMHSEIPKHLMSTSSKRLIFFFFFLNDESSATLSDKWCDY